MSLVDAFGSVATRLRDAVRHRHAHHDIRRLDAHLLRDIGVHPCAVPELAANLGARPGCRIPHDRQI